jgi:hypothetical protein
VNTIKDFMTRLAIEIEEEHFINTKKKRAGRCLSHSH